MKRLLIATLTVGLIWAAADSSHADTCPSPAPTCRSTGVGFSGIYSCTAVAADSAGQVHNEALIINIAANGTFTGQDASNNNSSGGATYKDFSLNTGTYCVNSDAATGYVLPTGSCPLPMVIDNGFKELRLIDSSENVAGAIVCTKQ